MKSIVQNESEEKIPVDLKNVSDILHSFKIVNLDKEFKPCYDEA